MQGALGRLADASSSSGGTALLDLGMGVFCVGLGAGVAFQKGEEPRDSFSRFLAVAESLAIGGGFLGTGVYALTGEPSIDEHRYARFLRDVRDRRMTALRLSQYEGELYADAISSGARRHRGAWVSLGVALAGAGLVALAATSNLRGGAKYATYLEGAVLIPWGTVRGIVALNSESDTEKEWRHYRSQQAAAPVTRLAVFPLLTRESAGLVAGGAF